MKVLFAALAVYLSLILGGPYIDSICTEGRISSNQAAIINLREWNKCPSYRNNNCAAREGDRILRRECAEFSRKLLFRDQVNAILRQWR